MSNQNPTLKSKTLGSISSKLINELLSKGLNIFTLDQAALVYERSNRETSRFLRDLVNRGILARIKSGLFLILQPGKDNAELDNWPVIAHLLSEERDYYISHYSAMRIHGMTTHPLVNVFITVPKRMRSKHVHNLSYQFIYIKKEHFWGSMQHWVSKHEKVNVTDLERTILDGFDRPDLCGGLKDVIRGIWSKQKEINWNKLIQYAIQYHSKAAIKRLGFILQTINIGADSLPFLQEILLDKKDYILLDPNGTKSGHFLSEWKIQVNVTTDEILASVWA